ncbi:unnamed protein product [Leuciscus chuanchicus]
MFNQASSAHNAWVLVTKTGDVETAGCTCIAGPGRSCSHAAAVLWKVENAVRQGKTGLACTDVQNCWNAGTKSNTGQQKIRDVSFRRHSRNNLYQPASQASSSSIVSTPSRKVKVHETLEEWQNYCLSTPIAALFTAPGSGLMQLTFNTSLPAQSAETSKAPLPLHHGDHNTQLECEKCRAFYTPYIDMTTTQFMYIEQHTKEQSREQLWHDMRRVRITASTAKNVPVRATTAPDKFLSEHLHPTFHGNAATRQGAEGEEHARQYLQDQGHDIDVKGLVVCPSEPWLAASLDGVMNRDTQLEIKCPVLVKNQSLTEALAAKSSEIKRMPTGDFHLSFNGPKGYYMQVQLGMHCTGLRQALLVIWSNTECLQLNVPYDQTFVEGHISRLHSFYFTDMLPKVVDDFDDGRLELCSRYMNVVKSA